jgi:hypothetical protein
MDRLTIGLIPKPNWGKNARSYLKPSQWKKLSKKVTDAASGACQVCKKHSETLHCHEMWEWDDITNVQTLVGLRAVCPLCHSAIHIGRSFATGQGERAFNHLMAVNGWTQSQTQDHMSSAYSLWQIRSREEDWLIDYTFLDSFLQEQT